MAELHLQHDFTLNPDGTGKVAVRFEGPAGEDSPSPEAFLRSELEHARGIDTWSEVHCDVAADRMVFQGTAYFRQLDQLRFHCQGFHLNLLDLVVLQEADGNVTVRTKDSAVQSVPPGAAVTRVDAATLAGERAKLAQSRGFIEEMFGGLRSTVVLRLPGAIGKAAHGKKLAGNVLQAEFAGRELVRIVDRLLKDDKLMRQIVQAGGASPETVMALLGDSGPIRVTTQGGVRDQFDYDAELVVAQAAFSELRALMGLPRGLERGDDLHNTRVIAAKLIHEADAERDLTPMGQGHSGLSFTIAGQSAEPILSVDEVTITSVVTGDGRDLTPADEWSCKISFPKLTNDRHTVYFDWDIPQAEAPIASFRELRGIAQCRIDRSRDQRDLEFAELVVGERSPHFGAVIERLECLDATQCIFEVRFELHHTLIVGCELLTPDGMLALNKQGYSACNDECTMTFQLELAGCEDESALLDQIRAARFILHYVSEVSIQAMPFALGDIDATGRPLGGGGCCGG